MEKKGDGELGKLSLERGTIGTGRGMVRRRRWAGEEKKNWKGGERRGMARGKGKKTKVAKMEEIKEKGGEVGKKE